MKRKLTHSLSALLILTASLALPLSVFAASEALAPGVLQDTEQAACEALKDLALPDAEITTAEYVVNKPIEEKPGIVVYGPDWKSPKSAFGQVSVGVPFCRVAAWAAPAINFEVWMPLAEDWNGKLNGVGNGALAGGINYGAMAGPLAKGYVAVSTDGGHQSNSPVEGGWIQDHPELWDDFGYRAIHLMTTNAKRIVEAFYGKPSEYSYFTGCSGGGQQGLAEAQRYPADYDGVASGAPANFPTRMWPGEVYPSFVTHQSAATLIPVEKLPMLNAAAVAACDKDDGVEDGVIDDPRKCDFDPATLLCSGADAPDCLTAAQVDSVKAIYAGLKDPTTGEQFWPGYEPGSEKEWAGHIGEPFVIPMGYFQGMVFDDAKWDWKSFDFTEPEDFAILYDADARYGPILDAIDPDLTAFRELGGKLILWHGWADQNIAPRNSINYYASVVADVGSEEETKEFLRLFMVPGMGHCSGGPGPNTFDDLAALDQWVTEGVAPEQIVATHLTAGKADRTRPLCPYPTVATYSGSGSTDEVASFACSPPE